MSVEWRKLSLADLPAVVALAQQHFEREVDQIFRTDPQVYEYNLALAMVNQVYNPYSVMLLGAWQDNQLLAYTWAVRGERAVWSNEEMVAVRMAHLDLDLSTRDRVRLLKEMMGFWAVWAAECSIPIICSTTMREDQRAFLRLHERMGYTVRGSIAYLRLA